MYLTPYISGEKMGMSFSSSGRVGYEWKTLPNNEYEQLLRDIQQLKDIHLPLKPTPLNTITLEFPSPEYIEELVTQLLRKEDEMRKSLKYQQYYSIEIKNDPTYGYQTVTDNLQRELADKVNIPLDLCLKVLQYSHLLTKKAYEISLYRKYNRLKKGSLKIGDYAPDIFLHSFPLSLSSHVHNKVSLFPGNDNGLLHRRPAVLVAGSYS